MTARDPDLDPVSFTASRLPGGATLDAKTGVFTWMPNFDQAGRYTVTFNATDGYARTSETVALVIAQTDRAPVWVPVNDQVAREGTELDVIAVPADPDGDPLKLTVRGVLPDGALFVPATGLFQWAPGYDQAGDHTITLTATDPSGMSVDTSFVVHVANVDRAPVLAESDHNYVIGQTRSFTLKASDPDAATTLHFSAAGLPQGATFDGTTGLFSWTPGPGQAGDYFATFTADDGELQTRETIVLHTTLEPVWPSPTSCRIELTPASRHAGPMMLIHLVAVLSSATLRPSSCMSTACRETGRQLDLIQDDQLQQWCAGRSFPRVCNSPSSAVNVKIRSRPVGPGPTEQPGRRHRTSPATGQRR